MPLEEKGKGTGEIGVIKKPRGKEKYYLLGFNPNS